MKTGIFAAFVLSALQLATSSPLAKREFKTEDWVGIDWRNVLDERKCTPEQAAQIKETVRKIGDEFAPFATANFEKHGVKDGAFHQIFMGRGQTKNHWEANDQNKWALHQVWYNLVRATQFPRYGIDGMGKSRQIQFHCYPPVDLGDSDNGCKQSERTLAFQKTATGSKPWIVFCPRFFTDKVPFLNDLTNRKPSNGNMENNMFIIRETKEHTLLHEYMHADMAFWSLVDATGKQHDKPYSTDRIIDWKFPDQAVAYGPESCSRLARENKDHGDDSIRPEILLNADSYAMYATLAWFQDKWGWKWNEKNLDYSYNNWHVTKGWTADIPKDELKRSKN